MDHTMEAHAPEGTPVVLDGERAVASASALADSTGWAVSHQRHVADLAGSLFDGTREMHGLSGDARVLLRCAGQCHDIGFVGGASGHHKSSAAIIMSAGIDGLTSEGVHLAAAIARYHRRALPDAGRHDIYRQLTPSKRRLVRWCAGLLRTADGLDRAHDGCVTAVKVAVERGGVTITASMCGPAELDLEGGRLKSSMLEAECGCVVEIVPAGRLA